MYKWQQMCKMLCRCKLIRRNGLEPSLHSDSVSMSWVQDPEMREFLSVYSK